MRYYLRIGYDTFGPYTPLDLVRLGINGRSIIKRERSSDWIRASEDEFLFEYIISPSSAAKKDRTNYYDDSGSNVAFNVIDGLFR